MKAPVLLRIQWADDVVMSMTLRQRIRQYCEDFGVDYNATAHWNVESMAAGPDGLVVCLAFFGIEPQ